MAILEVQLVDVPRQIMVDDQNRFSVKVSVEGDAAEPGMVLGAALEMAPGDLNTPWDSTMPQVWVVATPDYRQPGEFMVQLQVNDLSKSYDIVARASVTVKGTVWTAWLGDVVPGVRLIAPRGS